MDLPGSQRVGIVRQAPVLDGVGQPVLTDLYEPKTTDLVVWVDNASFELENQTSATTSEQQTVTETTTSNIAWVFLPVADGLVPAVDDSETAAPVAVDDITSTAAIRYRNRDYQLRGDAQLMEDYDGVEDHVFCLCERQTG